VSGGREDEIKCVIWDLDGTLWDGVLAESDEVQLKPGVVEVLRTLDSRGILLSIASRNFHDDAAGKLRELGVWDYFLYPEIHHETAKSEAVSRIQKNLNIGMGSLLFIDDQPFERGEVSHVHPEVTCVPAEQYRALLEEPRLMPRFVTPDSARRREMYREDSRRKKAEESFTGPREEFLAGLAMRFTISEAQEGDLARAAELTVRTHQLNATGRTYSHDELDVLRRSDRHRLYICELEDRYGPYGKIGLALLELGRDAWHLRLLLMSCRVMPRGVGTVLLSHVMRSARKARVRLFADFVPTERNRQMLIAYKFGGFRDAGRNPDGSLVLEADLSRIQPWPPYLAVVTSEDLPGLAMASSSS